MLLQLCFPLVWLAVTIRLYVHVSWLRFNKSLATCWRHYTQKAAPHKILVVGDGFAEGIGDWVVVGSRAGLASRLEKVVNAKVRRVKCAVLDIT